MACRRGTRLLILALCSAVLCTWLHTQSAFVPEATVAGRCGSNRDTRQCSMLAAIASLQLPVYVDAADGSALQDSNGVSWLVQILSVAALAAALYVANSSSQAGPDKDLVGVGPFSYYVDRCDVNFSGAFSALAAKHPQTGCSSIFTYYDSWVMTEFPELWQSKIGKQLPDVDSWPQHRVELIDRTVTDKFDSKRDFALKLQEAGCEDAFAHSFLTVESALQATRDEPSAMFFVKPTVESGGRGIRIVTRDQLIVAAPSELDVIQRAVQDIALIDRCKFTVRFYLLIHDGALHMYNRGLVIVHGVPYELGSVDYDVQVCSDGLHHGGGGKVQLRALDTFPDGDVWLRSISQRVREAAPALRPVLDASSPDRYVIIGGDAIIERSNEARLIELNFWPNLGSSNLDINMTVKQPMLRDAIAKALLGATPSGFERVDVGLASLS